MPRTIFCSAAHTPVSCRSSNAVNRTHPFMILTMLFLLPCSNNLVTCVVETTSRVPYSAKDATPCPVNSGGCRLGILSEGRFSTSSCSVESIAQSTRIMLLHIPMLWPQSKGDLRLHMTRDTPTSPAAVHASSSISTEPLPLSHSGVSSICRGNAIVHDATS